ncbi:hypothetical protein BH18ACT15_BH18ACT15_08540 [soil metagenome]
MGDDRGFTLIELLVTLSLVAILLTLSVAALRSYWLVQSIDGAADEVTTQLRQVQGEVTSESVPFVYAVSFVPGSSPTAASQSVTVWKYDTKDTPVTSDDTCTRARSIRLTNGTYVSSASFATSPLVASSPCTGAVSGSSFGFFFARGTATATTGSHIVIRQDSVADTKVVRVIGLTGRVQRS